ncbi:hypothetical protein BCR44DRAFT_1423187 [Catenaria anguillulae PL171]|uniref:Uncharacterized protein n=1 Tax=Catenaria anguillulae PL171 TaxID=765915 RepID=A0A1Y2I4F7_9FUNG|nr:hypothetical protein BCR44DRAFT_1423187 [Catenaria anguillulae PL171]
MDSCSSDSPPRPTAIARSSSTQSAFSILATEILVDIISLAHPRSQTAVATSFAIGRGPAGQSNRHRIDRHWRQHLIFQAPLVRQVTHELDGLGHWYPKSKQLDARITYFFKSRLPAPGESSEPASCIAPIFDWLFDTRGPFIRNVQAPMAGQNVFGEEWLLRWTFLPDAFQLVIYFLRGGQVELFKRSLAHLARVLPEMPSDLQPFSYWCQLGLDRVNMRAMFASEITVNDQPMSFPTFLYLLALVDWLPAALSALEAIFPSTSARFISKLRDWSFPNDCMMSMTLSLCEDPARVISTLDWLLDGGYVFDHDVHPFFARYTGWYTVFTAVFFKYDLPRIASFDKSIVQTELGYHLVTWALGGERSLLPLAFENGLIGGIMSQGVLGELLYKAIRESNEWLQDKVVCCAETPEELQAIVDEALTVLNTQECTQLASHELDPLFNPLVERSIDLTDFILEHASKWDQCVFETMLAHTRLANHIDFSRILNHWLGIFASNQSLPAAIAATFIPLLQRTIDSNSLCVTDLGTTPTLVAFAACLHQLAFTNQFYLLPQFRPLLISLGGAARSGGKSLDSLPLLLRGQLREVVAAASTRWDTVRDPDASTCQESPVASQAALDPRFAFDQVYALDPGFAKAAISWSANPPCTYIWALFDANEMASKVKPDMAIRALHQAINRDCGQEDFVTILERLPAQMRREVLARVLANARGKSKALLAAVAQVDGECCEMAVNEDVQSLEENDDEACIDLLL